MILIATIHWRTAKWIPVQRRYLEKHIPEGFRYFTLLSPGIESGSANQTIVSGQGDHTENLNRLLSVILGSESEDDDILVFLDGDAFPIAPLKPYFKKCLSGNPMVALERIENAGEYIPHPGFCAAPVGWWRETGLKWGRGSRIREFGNDPGARLYEGLQKRNISWGRIRRSNSKNLHPLFFGTYDEVLYHHGAGFRDPISRMDLANENVRSKMDHPVSRLMEVLPNSVFLDLKRRISPYRREEHRIIRNNKQLGDLIYQKICEDENFFIEFI